MTPIEVIRAARKFDDAKFVAMDSTNQWYAYSREPILNRYRTLWEGDICQYIGEGTCNHVDHTNCLIKLSQIKVQ